LGKGGFRLCEEHLGKRSNTRKKESLGTGRGVDWGGERGNVFLRKGMKKLPHYEKKEDKVDGEKKRQ